jgi:hypothetical protein
MNPTSPIYRAQLCSAVIHHRAFDRAASASALNSFPISIYVNRASGVVHRVQRPVLANRKRLNARRWNVTSYGIINL